MLWEMRCVADVVTDLIWVQVSFDGEMGPRDEPDHWRVVLMGERRWASSMTTWGSWEVSY